MFYRLRNQYAAYSGQNFAILIGHAFSFLMVCKVRVYLTIKDGILDYRRNILILYICNIKYIDTIYIHIVGFSSISIIRDCFKWQKENNKKEQRVEFGSYKRAVYQTVTDMGGKEAWIMPWGREEAMLKPLNTVEWEKNGYIS